LQSTRTPHLDRCCYHVHRRGLLAERPAAARRRTAPPAADAGAGTSGVTAMRMALRALLLLFLLAPLVPMPAHAVQPDEVLDDPALEARARALSAHLRCLVCQNQSIDDSDAPLAKDLRLLVRERLVAGDSDTEVTNFLVARYGEFVLLKPPFAKHTLLLWLTPLLLLL